MCLAKKKKKKDVKYIYTKAKRVTYWNYNTMFRETDAKVKQVINRG